MRRARSLSSATVVAVIVLIGGLSKRHMAVSGAAAIDPEVRPGPGPHFGIAGIVRRAGLNRIHVELLSYIRGYVANDDYVLLSKNFSVRSGDIGNRTSEDMGYTFCSKGLSRGCRVFSSGPI